ncbi:MAG: sensor histidine kinase, partial [Candidatus Omnitrophica bacterium]|nr:sensor histidine kinase [Candidatus Omnitrophota bacterium]
TNLYYIAQEALYNSVKHSHAGAIKISLEENQNFVVMTIQDDGIGIDPHHPNGGMGLSIIRYRASLIHADIQIENDPKGGTIVSCMIPMDQIV